MNYPYGNNHPFTHLQNFPVRQAPSFEYGPLELGGSTYQYFIVDVGRIQIGNMGPDGSPTPSGLPVMVPLAGPFSTHAEAAQLAEKILTGVPIVAILPTHTFSPFGRNR